MLRHERACDAANKTSKERRGFGLEEVHPGEPYGRPNSPPEPEEQADSERMSHRAQMGLCRRGDSRRRPSVLFFGGGLSLSWRIGRDRPPVRRVSLDLDTRCRYPTPVLPLPSLPTCLLWAEQE